MIMEFAISYDLTIAFIIISVLSCSSTILFVLEFSENIETKSRKTKPETLNCELNFKVNSWLGNHQLHFCHKKQLIVTQLHSQCAKSFFLTKKYSNRRLLLTGVMEKESTYNQVILINVSKIDYQKFEVSIISSLLLNAMLFF